MRLRSVRPVLAALALLACGACSSTRLEATWTRPGFAPGAIAGPVMVVGVVRDETVRRLYEDDMVARLEASGVKATRSYEALPGALSPDAADRLVALARERGATFLLSTALVGRDTGQVVSQDPMMYSGVGHRGWYGSYWGVTYGGSTEVRTYTIYVVETALTDVAADRIEWTARTRTSDVQDVRAGMREFVTVVLAAMRADGLLGG